MDKTASLKEKISDQIYNILTREELSSSLNCFLKDELKKLVYTKKDEIFKAETYNSVKNALKTEIFNVIKSQNFKNDISNFIDKQFKSVEKSNSTLGDIIPSAFINSIKVYVFNHKDDLIASLKKFISSETIDNKISQEISKVLNSINPMVSRFISSSSIQTKLIASINEYLDNSDNVMSIINLVNNQLDSILKKKVNELTEYFPAEGRKSMINSTANGVIDNLLSESFIDLAISKIEEKLQEELSPLNENSTKLSIKVDNSIDNFTNNYYPELLKSEQGRKLITTLSSNIVDNILQKRLIDLII